ncbi:MAG: glycosyl hydrolase [Leeuwenhoekiella sp.]
MNSRSSFKKITVLIFISFIIVSINSCKTKPSVRDVSSNTLYSNFQNPPAEAKPFVRWWWNDNELETQELDRELEMLNEVGFGGVEINPIEANRATKEITGKELVWMSEEWIDMLVHAAQKSKDLGMITDMIVGTGWPFGGEFLEHEETCQRITPHTLSYDGNSTIELSSDELISKMIEHYKNDNSRSNQSENTTYELFYAYLVPTDCDDIDQVLNLKDAIDENGQLSYTIEKAGQYNLNYGVKEQSFREVSHGAKGGAGDVMNHYREDVTRQYLSRLNKISERSGIPLSDLVRALFCDSIEISGANWTDNFMALFEETYGYPLDNWLPFIFYPAHSEYASSDIDRNYDADFKDQLKRVRHDYNRLLVDTFLSNFTQVFQDFCTENDLLCRYQAYGTPFLMGMFEGYMIPDIPESNSWLYSSENNSHDMKDPAWTWNHGKGYMVWNVIASSAGNLAGRKIVSCETMTNTKGVFRTTLQEIKQHDDMNFITGMNHAILHGFNYSPPSAGFPGWMRYGAYFNEQNPWWEYLHNWVDYNARLSYVFQNSQAEKTIAVLGPTADVWGDAGLGRGSYQQTPKYLFRLWESISQLGYSNDYVNEKIIQDATITNGVLSYGKMNYSLLVLASIESIEPETALALKRFVSSGGQLVVIDQLPIKSVHFLDRASNDEKVKTVMQSLSALSPQKVLRVSGPENGEALLDWTKSVLEKTELKPDVVIDNPVNYVYQINKSTNKEKIFFFNNSHRFETATFNASFPITDKYPYIWNPETGERKPFAYGTNASDLNIELKPLESLLLVFEEEKPKSISTSKKSTKQQLLVINSPWELEGRRVDGEVFNWKMDKLMDLSKSDSEDQNTFGGKIIYKTSFDAPQGATHIDLGEVNQGVTQLFVNGKDAGTRWYGEAIYPIAKYLREGQNTIEIHYATVLTNYAQSLKDNKAARQWSSHGAIDPLGIEGNITLVSYSEE